MKNLQNFTEFVNESLITEKESFRDNGYSADNSWVGADPDYKKAAKEIAQFLGAKDIKDIRSLSTEDIPNGDAEPGTVYTEYEKEFLGIKDWKMVHKDLPALSKEIAGGIDYSKKYDVLKTDDYGITVYFWNPKK